MSDNKRNFWKAKKANRNSKQWFAPSNSGSSSKAPVMDIVNGVFDGRPSTVASTAINRFKVNIESLNLGHLIAPLPLVPGMFHVSEAQLSV